jgi:hypothetical protein
VLKDQRVLRVILVLKVTRVLKEP